MGQYLDQMIKVYASHPLSELDAEPGPITQEFGSQTLEELAKKPGFSADQELVRDFKRRVECCEQEHAKEGLTLGKMQAQEQISACLRFLLDFAQEVLEDFSESMARPRIAIMKKLLFEMFGTGYWNKDQIDHFDFVTEKIEGWHNCFVSYTNKGSQIVNAAYRRVVATFVPASERRRLVKEGSNVLAEAIVRCLRREQITRCFYDKEDIKSGDDLNDEITPACTKTFTFVQLVQRELFDQHAAKNWCFEEYHKFLESGIRLVSERERYRLVFRKRLKPVLAGASRENVNPAGELRPEHRTWRNQILDQKRFLPLPITADEFDQTMHELAGQIVSLKFSIIDNVPA